MKRGQLAILVFAALAVGLIAFAGGGSDDGGGGSSSAARRREGAGRGAADHFPYSPEKKPLLEPLIERFNASKTQVGGKAVFVEGSRSPPA